MKKLKRVLALALTLAMCLSLVTVASAAGLDNFTDAGSVSEGNKTAVEVVTGLKIINGVTETTLGPDSNLKRGEAAKILSVLTLGNRVADSINSSTIPTGFSDTKNHWASGYIAYGVEEKYLAGMGDGTFCPEAHLTGAQFAKMLLNALGYGLKEVDIVEDGVLVTVVGNRYEGSNWAVLVAVDVERYGLTKGLQIDLNKPITRQNAMKMLFNALSGWDVAKNGAPGGTGNRYYNVAHDFEFTTSNTEKADPMGRPITTYKDAKGKEVLAVGAENPVATVTGPCTEGELFTKIGAKGFQGGVDKYVIMDKISYNGAVVAESVAAPALSDPNWCEPKPGAQAGFADMIAIVRNDKSNMAGGGEGTTIEVFQVGPPDSNHYTMVIVDEYVDEVDKVTPANDKTGAKRFVTLKNSRMTFETEDFAEKDVVLYTATATKVQTMKAATETVKGNITKIKGGVYTIDGKDYKKSKNATASGLELSNKASEWYLDSCGNIIANKNVQAAPKDWKYGIVVNYKLSNGTKDNALTGAEGSEPYERIQIINAEGKEEVLDIAFETIDPDGLTIKTPAVGNGCAANMLIAYTVNEAGKVTAIEKAGATAGTLASPHVKGTAFTTNGSTYATSKTVIFVLAPSATPGKPKYAVYTGYANLPGGQYESPESNGSGFAGGENKPDAAGAVKFSVGSDVYGTETKESYAVVTNATATKTAGQKPGETVFTYDAVVDGTATTISYVGTAEPTVAENKLYTVKFDEKGNFTSLTEKTPVDAQITTTESKFVVAGSAVYYTDEKTVIYKVEKDPDTHKITGFAAVEQVTEVTGRPGEDVVKLLYTDTSDTTPAKVLFFYTEKPAPRP